MEGGRGEKEGRKGGGRERGGRGVKAWGKEGGRERGRGGEGRRREGEGGGIREEFRLRREGEKEGGSRRDS